jgi:uncharacterized membrane protein YkoI
MLKRLKQLFWVVAIMAGALPLSAEEQTDVWLLASIDRDAAAEIVRQKKPGRVLEVKTIKQSGKEVHVIKILTNGDRVKQYRVDAESGKIIGNK